MIYHYMVYIWITNNISYQAILPTQFFKNLSKLWSIFTSTLESDGWETLILALWGFGGMKPYLVGGGRRGTD